MSQPSSPSANPSPLRPVEFQILISLAAGERHGYAIILETEERTSGQMQLEPGTLYRALRRMKAGGLIREMERSSGTPVPGEERRRYYSITSAGTAAASAEADRMARLVDAARAARLLPAG